MRLIPVWRWLTLKTLANSLIGIGLLYLGLLAHPILSAELRHWKQGRWSPPAPQPSFAQVLGTTANLGFGAILQTPPPLPVQPAHPYSSLIIEKIDVNAPIIWNVSVRDEKTYLKALDKGVAHAAYTSKPNPGPGNTYIFAHSTLNPLEIKRFSGTFTRLSELAPGDRIILIYAQERFDYLVKEVSVVPGFDLTPLTREVGEPTLTLQTCEPPGIPKNRLVVTAVLTDWWKL